MPQTALRFSLAAALSAALLLPDPAGAVRCATGPRDPAGPRISPAAPLRRGALAREAAQAPDPGVQALVTGNFRILWGAAPPAGDPHWAPGPDGVPLWVRELGDALEAALLLQESLGFPPPYGGDRYLLDVYVADTGATVRGAPVLLGHGFFGYADVDPRAGAAYFVFGADFSGAAAGELPVLRAVAAHELFHAVQRAAYPWDDPGQVPPSRWERDGWWFEATATWMEEVCAPGADDYVPFVRSFLERPQERLALRDGRREYGASVFPGFLWLRHGPALWVEVLRDSFGSGVEGALEAALAARGTDLPGALADFWSAAAHPEDTWPDGAAYRGAGSPPVAQPGSLPASLAATPATAPARFGASLVAVPAGGASVSVAVRGEPGTAFRAASSRAVPSAPGLRRPAGDVVYVAVVNVSQGEAPAPFEAVLEGEAPAGPSPEAGAAAGGEGGGCFLSLLLGGASSGAAAP